MVCEETTAVRSIRLALNGTMNIFWHDPVDRVDHAEFEDYLGWVQQSPLSSQFAFQCSNLPQLLNTQKNVQFLLNLHFNL